MQRSMKFHVVGASIALTMFAASCSSDADEPTGTAEVVATPSVDDTTNVEDDTTNVENDTADVTDDFDNTTDVEDDSEAAPPAASPTSAGRIDLSLERDDVDCSEDGLGSSDETEFVNAHVVVGGTLGALCFGDEDATLIQAWEELSTITPALQLADLGLFGGFVSGESGEETTLAFVNTLDDDGTLFQMSVNLDSYDEDSNEAQLTMAHEFSHVFTALPSQIDRSAEAAESCGTYDNGEGCYEPDSIMAQWIELFWGDGLIDEIDPEQEASGVGGEERCDLNASFFGPYAASSPEEDFAESFSAFVYQLETFTAEQDEKMEWMAAQPGLAEFRDRAIAAGAGPLQNNFEECGSAA